MAQPTYPGVYVEEVPSGVRPITGVSTSVPAFIGVAESGPVGEAIKVFNFTEFISTPRLCQAITFFPCIHLINGAC